MYTGKHARLINTKSTMGSLHFYMISVHRKGYEEFIQQDGEEGSLFERKSFQNLSRWRKDYRLGVDTLSGKS